MKFTTCLAASLLAFALIGPETAHAQAFTTAVVHGSGSDCDVQYGTNKSNISVYTSWGVVSFDTTATTSINCPLQFSGNAWGPTTVNPGRARVDYYDLNSATSGGDVSCSPHLVKASTTTVVSLGSRYSCATAGGCTAGGSTFSGGAGYLEWADVTGDNTDVVSVSFSCQLPKHISGYWLAGSLRAMSFEISAQ